MNFSQSFRLALKSLMTSKMRALLTMSKELGYRRVICAFQPHTYSRTKNFLTDFSDALSLADKIVLADIYAAREKDPGDISSKDLAEQLKKLGKEAFYIGSLNDIKNFFEKNLMNDDLLITMGAGNIVEVGESLLKQ